MQSTHNQHIHFKKSTLKNRVSISLPTSKSISNRVLIIDALSGSQSSLHHLSSARDTQTMQRLLKSSEEVLDVLDAGTTMRFLCAYLAITGQEKTLTGTARMQQRPIGVLTEALEILGADITFLNKEGYPPLRTGAFKQQTNVLSIRGDVSSQYISALLMIAPTLPEGLSLTLEGHVGSKPYINMTLQVMEQFGVESRWDDNIIHISHQQYKSTTFTVEGDWSGASYWYSFVALSDHGSVLLEGLEEASLQGDQSIAHLMTELGVRTTYSSEGALLTKIPSKADFSYDFTHSPDLAQTVAVICAAKGVHATFTGLESLKIKETDRVLALQNELAKIGASFVEESDTWTIIPSTDLPGQVSIDTYEDHRMAMAFAPLCMLMDVGFDDASVVNKSYPSFWEDVKLAVS